MPKPEKHVFVCTQSRPLCHPRSSCSQHGCAEVYEELLWQLEQRQLFGKVQVTATGCMGPCSEGPTVLVYPEGVMYGGLKKTDVAAVVDEHLLNGRPLKNKLVPAELWG